MYGVLIISIVLLSFLSLIILFSYWNSKKIKWETVDKILIFEEQIENFENIKIESILEKLKGRELNKIKAINYFKKSKRSNNHALLKGGYYYGLILFKEKKPIKLKLSAAYGLYTIPEYKQSYIIIGDSKLRHTRWKELYN